MEIKTKYNEGDKVYFLTKNSTYAKGAFDSYLKEGEVFACEATVMKIKIKVEDKNIEIHNSLRTHGTGEWVDIHENFCSPDMVQLGNDVSNRYRVATASKKKKKR